MLDDIYKYYINYLKLADFQIHCNIPNWFGTNAVADLLFRPTNSTELQKFIKTFPHINDINILGCASNSLISDHGISGVTIKLSHMSKISLYGDYIEAEAGCLDNILSNSAADHSLSGLEFLSTIPGTIGGAIKMNAGSFHQETFDSLVRIRVMDFNGNIFLLNKHDIEYGYRYTNLSNSLIILSGTFKLKKSNFDKIKSHMNTIIQRKSLVQPVNSRTGGSTFCNLSKYDYHKNGLDWSSWKLIQAINGQNIHTVAAKFSAKHANFIINNTASAKDISDLIDCAKTTIKNKFGLDLRVEIQKIGRW